MIQALARGGMAEIFLAKQQGPAGYEKTVVIKRVLSHYSSHSDFVAMFLDEARLAAQLSHPNIVQIYDFGEADGSYYLAMEYMRGEDLHSLVKLSHKKGISVSPEIAATIVAAACDALYYAHSLKNDAGQPLNIVHRDISPSNLFITFQGVVKVLDFGIARAEGKVVKTANGMIRGKIAYMAPEQARSGPLDGRADVWALGTVLHELLTGKRLFLRGNDVDSFRALLKDPIPRASDVKRDVPEQLDAICAKALARNVNERYRNAREMYGDLDAYLSSRSNVPASTLLQGYMQDLVGEENVSARLHAPVLTPGEQPALRTPRSRSAVMTPVSRSMPIAAPPESTQEATVAQRKKSSGSMPGAPAATPAELPEPMTAADLPSSKPTLFIAGGIVVFLGIVAGLIYTLVTQEPPPRLESRPLQVETIQRERQPEPEPDPEPEPPVEPVAVPIAKPTPAPEPKYVERAPDVPDRVPLPKNHGLLDVNCVPWCRIFLDGKDTGRVSPAVGIPLLAGKHRLKLINTSGLELVQDVVITKGAVTRQVIMF